MTDEELRREVLWLLGPEPPHVPRRGRIFPGAEVLDVTAGPDSILVEVGHASFGRAQVALEGARPIDGSPDPRDPESVGMGVLRQGAWEVIEGDDGAPVLCVSQPGLGARVQLACNAIEVRPVALEAPPEACRVCGSTRISVTAHLKFEADAVGEGDLQWDGTGATVSLPGKGLPHAVRCAECNTPYLGATPDFTRAAMEWSLNGVRAEEQGSVALDELARERADVINRIAQYAVHRHNDCWQTGRCICGLDDVLYEAGIEPVIRLTAAQGEALKRIMAGAEPDRRATDADRPAAEGSQDAGEEATRDG